MRSFLLAVILGLTGSIFGYWQYSHDYSSAIESFQDPKERLTEELKDTMVGQQPDAAPKVEVVGGTSHQFGTMAFRTSRSHQFVFKNVGTAPLSLEVIRSSCKCTIGELEKSTLQPGESAGVDLTWTAEGMLSEYMQTATVRTNDPEQLEVKLTISGHIGESIFFGPPTVLAGEISSREPTKVSTRLFSMYDKPLEIASISWKDRSTADRVKIDHRCRKVEPGEFPAHADVKYVAEIDVDLLPGLPAGPLDGRIGLTTNLGETADLSFSVKANIISDIRIIAGVNYDDQLNILNLGKIKSSEGGVRKFMIGVKLSEGEVPEISASKIKPDESIEVRVLAPNIKGNQAIFPIEVEVPKGAPPVSLIGANPQNFGWLAFRTNMKYAPEVKLFLRIEVEDH